MTINLNPAAIFQSGQTAFEDGENAVYHGLTQQEKEKSEEAKRKVENQPGIVNDHLASMQTGR